MNQTKEQILREIYWLLPSKKSYKHGRSYFQGEGQELDEAKIDGWNNCRDEIRGILEDYYNKTKKEQIELLNKQGQDCTERHMQNET